MRPYWLGCLLLCAPFVVQAANNKIQYQVTPHFEAGAPYYHVEVRLPLAGQEVVFVSPKHHVSAQRDPDTKEHITYQIIGDIADSHTENNRFVISMASDTPLTLSYDFYPDVRLITPGYPFLLSNYFAWMGEKLLAFPQTSTAEIWDISMSVDVPQGWASAFSPVMEIQDTLPNFLKKGFVAGQMQVDCDDTPEPTCLSFYGNDNSQYEQAIRAIIDAQRAFWGEVRTEPYWVHIFNRQVTGINGTHADNAMMLFLPPPEPHRLPFIYYSLSHELFHEWLGTRYAVFAGKDRISNFVVKAFMEGFTDYYGARFVHEIGLVDEKGLNTIILRQQERYLEHPSYGKPIEDVSKTHLFEHYLTPQVHLLIRHWIEEGLTPKDIDAFILTLPEGPLTKEELYAQLSKQLSPAYAEEFKHYIEDGAPLPPSRR